MKKNSIRIGLLAVAIIFIAIGCVGREFHDVFMKAVYICLECIGIG